jgi:hypothetical protein
MGHCVMLHTSGLTFCLPVFSSFLIWTASLFSNLCRRPLYGPCKCSGSIGLTHQDCLMSWLEVTRGDGKFIRKSH